MLFTYIVMNIFSLSLFLPFRIALVLENEKSQIWEGIIWNIEGTIFFFLGWWLDVDVLAVFASEYFIYRTSYLLIL